MQDPTGRGAAAASYTAMVAALLGVLVLAGCANRQARPIEAQQPHDKYMNCGQIRSEISAAQRLIGSYQTDHSDQSARNGQAVVGALFTPVALMHLDTGAAADTEMAAYSQRIAHLEKLSKEKACS